jgi:hypothetical protein
MNYETYKPYTQLTNPKKFSYLLEPTYEKYSRLISATLLHRTMQEETIFFFPQNQPSPSHRQRMYAQTPATNNCLRQTELNLNQDKPKTHIMPSIITIINFQLLKSIKNLTHSIYRTTNKQNRKEHYSIHKIRIENPFGLIDYSFSPVLSKIHRIDNQNDSQYGPKDFDSNLKPD